MSRFSKWMFFKNADEAIPGTFSNVLPPDAKPSVERLRDAIEYVKGLDGIPAADLLERASRPNPVPPRLTHPDFHDCGGHWVGGVCATCGTQCECRLCRRFRAQ